MEDLKIKTIIEKLLRLCMNQIKNIFNFCIIFLLVPFLISLFTYYVNKDPKGTLTIPHITKEYSDIPKDLICCLYDKHCKKK